MSLWLDQRSHGKAERSGRETAKPAIVFTFQIQLDCENSWYRWHEFQSQWKELEERKETKQSQALTQSWLWSGSGLDPGLDRKKWAHIFCVCCRLDAVWQEKDDKVCRQQVDSLAAWQPGLTTVSAWRRLGCATVAAWLLDCLASWLSAAWKLGSVALQQFVGWLLGTVNDCRAGNPKTCINGPNINSPIHCIIPKVWINSLGKVWIGGLDRLWDRGLIQTLHFEPQPCVYTSESFRFNHLLETLALSAKIETNMFCSASYLKHHKDFSSLRLLEAMEHQSYFIPVWCFWHCSNRPTFLTQLCFSCF